MVSRQTCQQKHAPKDRDRTGKRRKEKRDRAPVTKVHTNREVETEHRQKQTDGQDLALRQCKF